MLTASRGSRGRYPGLDQRQVPLAAAIPALLVILVVAAFWPSFGGDYVSWDDFNNFTKNTMWQGLGWVNLRWMFTTELMGHYHPGTWLSFGLQYVLFGGGPLPGHVINVLLHALNGVLLFLVFRKVLSLACFDVADGGGGVRLAWCAGLGAALFAVHPLRVESVAWITERRDVLSTAFLLGAVLTYFCSAVSGQVRLGSRGWYWATVGLMLLSCLCKAWGMSFFAVLLVLDAYPLRRVPAWSRGGLRAVARLIVEKTPMILIGLVTAAVASHAQAGTDATWTLSEWTITQRLVQACYGLWFYVLQTIMPHGHAALYQLDEGLDPLSPRYLIAYVFVASLIGVFAWSWRNRPGVAAAIAVYVIEVSPVLGLNQSGVQMVADRYSYLSTMPFAALVAGGMLVLLKRDSFATLRTAAAIAGLVVLVLSVLTYAQCTVWQTTRTLWEHAASVSPTSQVLYSYATTVEPTDRQFANELFRRAAEQEPPDGRALYQYAISEQSMGREEHAGALFLEATKYMKMAYMAHQNLGIMYYKHGMRGDAIRHYELAIRDVERPGQKRPSGGPYMVMALAMLDRGDRAAAVAHLRKALTHADTRADAASKLKELGEAP